MITLYEYTSRPRYWIVRDKNGYWLVPVRNHGWQERTPFIGHVTNLRRITDLEGIDLGLPDEAD